MILSKNNTNNKPIASRASTRRVWPIVIMFLVIIILIIGGVVAFARQSTVTSQAAAFASQPLSGDASARLQVNPLAPEDYLVGGQLTVVGALTANTITSSADMLVGSKEHALALQGSDTSLSATVGGSTNTLRFAAPSGSSKSIVMPNASGTVAVSASGALVLDASGNLSCPSCSGGAPAATTNITNVTNNYSASTINAVSLFAGTGIAITDSNGTSTIAATGANTSLSNLSSVAINTDVLPGSNNTIDIGSSTNAFRNGYYGTSVNAPLFDTVSPSVLNIGTTTATGINLGADTTIAAGKSLTANGSALFKNTVNSTAAFQIQNASGTALLRADTSQGVLTVGTFTPTVIFNKLPATVTSFALQNTYAHAVASADFNGDGNADFVQVDSNVSSPAVENVLAVYIGNGDGTFTPKAEYSADVGTLSVTVADFNGDGYIDMASGSVNGKVSIYINNGNGTFAAPISQIVHTPFKQPITYQQSYRPIISTDLNGDGRADLLYGDYSLINTGNGSFAVSLAFGGDRPIGSSYSSAFGIFNDTGFQGVSVANSGRIKVFANDGSGALTLITSISVPGVQKVIAIDLNDDGLDDLAALDMTSGVLVFINNGGGNFSPSVSYDAGQGYAATNFGTIVAADLNDDGSTDLFMATSENSLAFINNGDGTFGATLDYGYEKQYPVHSVSADFNNDGSPDILVARVYAADVILTPKVVAVAVPQSAQAKLLVNSGPGMVGQIIQGSTFQIADLLQVKNDLNATLFSVGSTGNVGVAGTLQVAKAITALSTLSVASTLNASSTLNVAGTFTATGRALFKNASISALRVQQSNGTTVFGVDTIDGRVGIGTAAPGNKLSVNNLTTTDATAQLAIGTGTAKNKGLAIQGAIDQTADLLQAQDSTGTVLASISATGDLTVVSAVVSGNLTVRGHIITDGTIPTIAAGVAACTAPTVTIVGNDTSGTVTVTSGASCVADNILGTIGTITFNTAFATAPRVVLTPSSADAANLKLYNGNATTTTFTVDTTTVLTDATSYKFNYWVVQ